MTVSPWLNVPGYPFPTVNEVFAALKGGTRPINRWNLMNLVETYSLNEHPCIGLYRYTRMPYAISSAPAKCQETMVKVIQGLNIIIGSSQEEDLSNLRAVLDHLSTISN